VILCLSDEVERWAEKPDPHPAEAARIKAKLLYVLKRIEATGHLAGDKFFKKINGVDDLWEVRLEVANRAIRIFGSFAPGGRLCLTVVLDGKKTRSLATKEYQRIARVVASHVKDVERKGCEG
jgi:hypothetical protein